MIPRGISSTILITLAIFTTTGLAQGFAVPAAPVPETLYDLNINNLSKPGFWPVEHFASFRTFSFRWYKIERRPSEWDFSIPDMELKLAEQHGVSPLPLLMGIPEWADKANDPANTMVSPDPLERGRQRSIPKDSADWETYIRTVATRYKGRIHAYELWNEPDTNITFREHPEELVRLNAIAYRVLHEVDPTIVVVSPALSSGDPVPEHAVQRLKDFAAADLYRYCDVIAYHAYLVPARPAHATALPEAIFADTSVVRSILHSYHVPDMPMWNTEIGWQLLNDDTNTGKLSQWLGDPLTPAMASGFVVRTYLLGWAAGWQRVYWYSWNAGGMSLTEDNGGFKICEGAYNTIRDWTVGHRIIALQRHKDGTWIASLRSAVGRPSWVIWSESVRGHVSIPATWRATTATDLSGARTPIESETEIGPLPILLQ